MVTPNNLPPLHRMDPVMAYQRGKADGIKEERKEGRRRLLEFLEVKYMDPKIERGSPSAEAILTLAKEVSEEFRDGRI